MGQIEKAVICTVNFPSLRAILATTFIRRGG